MHRAKRSTCYIVKPEDGAKGDGIFLVTDWNDFVAKCTARAAMGRAYVVQEYIKPLLLEGYKFDLRLYALLKLGGAGSSGGEEVEVHVCREGLARLCTEPYKPPDARNMHHMRGHLTNYAVNKESEKFAHAAGAGKEPGNSGSVFELGDESASKRSISTTMTQLAREAGLDPGALWESLDACCLQSLVASLPQIRDASQTLAAEGEGGDVELYGNGFQLFGIDVILDARGRPHLLEMNTNPSMAVTNDDGEPMPLDAAVKQIVVEGALGLVLGEEGHEAALGYWEQLDLERCGEIRVREALQEAFAAHKRKDEIPPHAFRKLLVASGMLTGAAAIRADEVYRRCRLRWQGEYKPLGMEAFFEMITELASQEWPGLSEKEALGKAAGLLLAAAV